MVTTSTRRECLAADGVTLAYGHTAAQRDDAPRLALVHSLALDRHVWDGVIAELAGQVEIVAVDCRGHGRSSRAPGPYTAELFAHDLSAVLDDAGWSAAVVAGCSMGGCVAMAFAGLFPTRARALGLIDTTAWYGPDGARQFGERAETARAKGLAALVPFQMSRWFGDAFLGAHADVVARHAATFQANDLDCYAAACALLGAADLRAHLPHVRVPATIMVGSEDQATPLSMSEALQRDIAGSRLVVLPGARHLTPIECPDAVAAELRALVARSSESGK